MNNSRSVRKGHHCYTLTLGPDGSEQTLAYEAQSSDLMRSLVKLADICLLYGVEREARDIKLCGEKRLGALALRLAKLVRILDGTKAYLEREQPECVADEPGRVGDQPRVSKLESVEVLLRRGRLGGNGAERSLLGIAVGRKNRIFFGIENGGWTAAVLTSFITSCRRLNIDPLAYFRDRLGVWRLQHLK